MKSIFYTYNLLMGLNSGDREQTAAESFGWPYALRNFVVERFNSPFAQFHPQFMK
jgi:hypothetical protein